MGAVWFRGWVDLRRYAWSTVGWIAIVALAGGVVLTAIAGASRTRSALPRFVDSFRSEDLVAYYGGSLGQQRDLARRLATLPEVAAVAPTAFVGLAAVGEDGRPEINESIEAAALVDASIGRDVFRPIVVDGRLPSAGVANEIVINERLAELRGIGVGDDLPVIAFAAEQLEEASSSLNVEPAGPALDLEISGIVRWPGDLGIDIYKQADGIFADSGALYLTPAYWERFGEQVATYGIEIGVLLADGVSPATFERAAGSVTDELSFDTNFTLHSVSATRRSIDLQSYALLASAGLLALVASVLVGLSIARRVSRSADDDRVLVALGWTSYQLAGLAVVRTAPVALGGAAGAMLVALALSPLSPIGTARRAEIDPGFDANWAVLVTGALVITGFVVAVAVLSSRQVWLTNRARSSRLRRPSTVGGWLTRSGASPPVLVGVSAALDARRRGSTFSVRTAQLGAVIAVAAISGAVVFGDSVDRLVGAPALWGQTWDVEVGGYDEPNGSAAGANALRSNGDVAAFSGVSSNRITIDGRSVVAVAMDPVKGALLPVLLEGDHPDANDEIALGRRTIEAINKNVGDEVELSGPGGRASEVRIVGIVVVPAALPPFLSANTALGEGATLTLDRLAPIAGIEEIFATTYFVRFDDSVDPASGIERLSRDFGGAFEPITTVDIESLRRIRALPWVIAVLVAALGIVTVGHALAAGVRRRHELGVLKVLGFDRHQVQRTVAVQASTFCLIAVVIGLPLGIVAGRLAWRQAMDALGIVVSPVIPVALLLLVPTAFVVVNAVAALPARAAGRIQPTIALRAD